MGKKWKQENEGESEEREIKRKSMRKIMREIRGGMVTKSKKERFHEIQRGMRNWRRRWRKHKRVRRERTRK